MPSIFGMAAATYILTEIADWGMVTEPVGRPALPLVPPRWQALLRIRVRAGRGVQ